MSHLVTEGSIQLLKIVTPGAYWIKCNSCDSSRRTPTSIKDRPYSGDYYPQQGEKVFARDEDSFFYRGTVCGRRLLPNTSLWVYVIYLTDTFQVKDFDQQDVYPTFDQSSASCPSAHLVSLCHILPQIPPAGYGKCGRSTECKAFEDAVTHWDRSVASMAHLMEDTVQCSFVQSKLINGSIYGEISTSTPLRTKTGELCYDLSDYLHFEELAVKMTFRFDAVVKALMSNSLVDFSKLLAPFDPFRTAKIEPKLHIEEPPKPETKPDFDFTGFKVHSDDIILHQSLISQEYYVNILYSGAVPRGDTVVRYVSPDGRIVLGTVLNFDIKCAKLDSSDDAKGSRVNGRKFAQNFSFTDNVDAEFYYSDEVFEKFPPYYQPAKPRPLEPGQSLLSYDFHETYRNFKATGGVFKEMLLPYPLSSAVEKLMVGRLDSLGVECLHEWQKLCLPTLSSRKNLAVLGSKSSGKLTLAIISALSWMSYVNPTKLGSIHPQLIIFISDFIRAGKAGNLCKQLTDFRMILSTSAFVTEKQKEEARNGCDVLITTPGNWAKLVSEKVFNYSRLNHVIFDEFDRLHEIHPKDVMNIFEALELSSSRRVQAVLVSNSWGGMICDRKFQEKLFEFPTICIMDAILACLYYNLTPTAVFVEHDWMKHLREILSDPAEKRLLVCKDEREGRSIIEKISHIERVLFAHENQRNDGALKIVREWDKTGNKLLVCTDNTFQHLDILENVEVMISWMISSWTTLCHRFLAFRRGFDAKKGLSLASAYLFCDSEKIEELLLIKNISSNVRCINGNLDEHLGRASVQADHCKLTHICPSVFMFGKCKDVPLCPLRHVFRPDDEAEVPDSRLFLNVDILRVHSAFRYSVRVKEIVSNYDCSASVKTSALVSKLKEIEDGLAKSCRNRCSPSALKMGQMVGACIVTSQGDLLRRVTVNSTPEGGPGLYSLSIVDFEEPDIRLPHSQLFVLPDELAKYPKDVTDLYIAGLMPVDFNSDWRNDTYEYMTKTLNKLSKDSTFLAGNVEIVTNRSVLVDTLHCFTENEPPQKTTVSVISSEFYSLKDLILASGFVVKNPVQLPLLPDSTVKTRTNNPIRSPLSIHFLNCCGKYGRRSTVPNHPVPAVVSSYVDPGLLYVQLKEESEKLRYLEDSLTSTLNRFKLKLSLVALDELCAFQNNGSWNRALIVDIFAYLEKPLGSVQILFVDYGDSIFVNPNELYCLPGDFVDVPFFALQCELTGIKPFRDEKWHEKATEELGLCVRGKNSTKILTVDFRGTKNVADSSCYPCRYLVVLRHPEDQSINYHLARRGLACFDPETKHVLYDLTKNGPSKFNNGC